MSFGERNTQALTELEALLEKVQYGSLDASLDVHNKRITGLTVYGKKVLRYGKADTLKPYEDILKRIKDSVQGSENTKITFIVDIKKGLVDSLTWHSSIRRNYEGIDSSSK